MTIQPCAGCFICRKKEMCIQKDNMSILLNKLVESDYVIFETPIYMLDMSGSFRMMVNRLYPMLDGDPGKYTPRHPKKRCMLIITQGAPLILFSSARRRVRMILKSFGFKIDQVISLGFANELGTAEKNTRIITKVQRNIEKVINEG